MPEHDSRALPLSTASGEAAAAYREGVDRLLSARPGAGERLDAAIAADPDFALAHAARARAHAAMAEGAAARDRIARAAALVARRGTERERAHVALLTHAIAGRGAEAVDAGLAHAEAWPRDALALSLLLGAFGLLAFSGRADHDAARLALCEALAPRIGEDWWFTGHHGWSLAEAGRPAEGMPLAERALALRPDNGNAAHALAHALFELDRSASAGDFLAGWLPGYDPAAPLHGHLSWHRALALLEAGDAPGALALYDSDIAPPRPASAPLTRVSDAVSLLWRVEAAGGTAGGRWPAVAADAAEAFPGASPPFMQMHLALLAAATGQPAPEPGDGPAAPVLRSAGAAVRCFAEGRFRECAAALAPVLAELPRIGGSHAQRDLLEELEIEALLRAGAAAEARVALDARLHRRPSPRDARRRAAA